MSDREVRYARSGDVSVAYQTVGDGPRDLVFVTGFTMPFEAGWDYPPYRRFIERLASFSRVIMFDKRGIGLSDHVEGAPTLEQRMDDVRAVMDAAGSTRPVMFGISEGAQMCILFAASHPDRTTALILYGGMARSTEAPDYPFAPPAEAAVQSALEFFVPFHGTGASAEVFSPSVADDPSYRSWLSRWERIGAPPNALRDIFVMFLDIDVRSVLPAILVPTLVLHRHGDRAVNVRAGRYLAEHIPGARFVELQGIDHLPWAGDHDSVAVEIEEFVTGARPEKEIDRVLATVLFTDIVDSTKVAADQGDAAWRVVLDRHNQIVRKCLTEYRGREIKTTGDGFLATFDGPARAIRCARAIIAGVRETGIEVRAGLHSGEVEMVGDDVAGIAVNTAARVADISGSGEVLVSQTVRDLVAGSGIAFEDRGTHVLKGVPGEWRLFSVSSC
jgi:class 3 adenylate cyclase